LPHFTSQKHSSHSNRIVTPIILNNGTFAFHGYTGRGKTQKFAILSEARNLSFFVFLQLSRREIPRFARNDKINAFSAACIAKLVSIYSAENDKAILPV